MHLIEILLPLADNSGRPFPDDMFGQVRDVLTAKFGGLTAFSRAPARGLSRDGAKTVHDDILVFEVMADDLDRAWWEQYRVHLERHFAQDEVMVRSSTVTKI
jgi:hypothetical protein